MPHRSRLTAVLVDVPAGDHARAVEFWGAAFGRPGERSEKFPEYVDFGQVTPGVEFMVQSTGDEQQRLHLDIESDDVEAEVARLTALGAQEVERHYSWVVMRDPVGTTFCVVAVQIRDAFERDATRWD